MSETFFTREDNGESRACLLLNYEYLKLLYKLKRNYACVRTYFSVSYTHLTLPTIA